MNTDLENLKEAAALLRPTRPDLASSIEEAIDDIEELMELLGLERPSKIE
jgi:hypothetical protein